MVRKTLQDDILDVIGQQIVSGILHPGQILRTEDFEIEHDASRTVLRETLKVLESMRLIGLRRRIGITVLDRTEWSVFDPRVIRWRLAGADRDAQLRSLTELRIAVEPVAAHNAALFATPEQREELLSLAALLEESGRPRDAEAYLQHDIAFHSVLLRASGNEMFAALSSTIAAVLTGRMVHHLVPDDPTPESLRLHLLVARSIAEANADEAESGMRGILSEVTQQMLTSPRGAAPVSGHHCPAPQAR
ncbi:FCD domain-containing protein [Streptosporangium sp. NPDC006007]|uniref:FadR/GntR family transcriptional regulator n=1 Tax=Streptosporangium sp. NPDC006007 TaxID=3154575 RepID=UPI0033AAA3A1